MSFPRDERFQRLTLLFLFQVRAASGIKGLFHRNPKQASLDSHAAALRGRKQPFGAHLLRRTASAPTKGQPKVKRGFPEISIDTKDCNSEGASEERESEEGPAAHTNGEASASAAQPWEHGTNGQLHKDNSKGKAEFFCPEPRAKPFHNRGAMSEPLRRANRLRLQDPLEQKPGVFARVAVNGSSRVGVMSNCIKCVIGTKESPDLERKVTGNPTQCKPASPRPETAAPSPTSTQQAQPVPSHKHQTMAQHEQAKPPRPDPEPKVQSFKPIPMPRTRSKVRQTLGAPTRPPVQDASARNARSCSVPRRRLQPPASPAPPVPDSKTSLCRQDSAPPNYGSNCRAISPANDGKSLSNSNWSSCSSLCSLDLPSLIPPQVMDNRKRAVGTLQREMNALFAQKMEEIRSKSPLFFAGKIIVVSWNISQVFVDSRILVDSRAYNRNPCSADSSC